MAEQLLLVESESCFPFWSIPSQGKAELACAPGSHSSVPPLLRQRRAVAGEGLGRAELLVTSSCAALGGADMWKEFFGSIQRVRALDFSPGLLPPVLLPGLIKEALPLWCRGEAPWESTSAALPLPA